jgi:hypothetical protein
MRISLRAAAIVGLAAAAACQTPHNGYADLVNRPMPTSDAERDHECQWIRSEEARQQSVAQVGSTVATTPMMAVAYQSMARKNIAYLQSRYSQIQCNVFRVAPTAPVLQMPPPQQSSSNMTVEECFKKCRELTSQTEAQCFDACRH